MSQIPLSPGAYADETTRLAEPWKAVAAILCVLTLFRLVVAAYAPIVPDEAYYWLWSRAPAAGYYDHPPMIAWWIWASTKLFGDTTFAIRFLPVIATLVSSVAVVGTARELFGDVPLTNRAALWFNATLLVGVGAMFSTPDAPSVMFWALATWALAALRRTGNPRLWLLVGVLAGLGCLSKYTNLFFGVGLLLWLAMDRKAWRWLRDPWLWSGGAAALVVFLPNIVWNADHRWLTFAKQFGRIDHGGLSGSHVLEFVGGQFGLLNPIIAGFAVVGVVRAFRSSGETKDGARFLVILGAPLFVYMCLHSLHDRVQGNWPAPLYPAAAILASVGAVGAGRWVHSRRLARSAAPVGIGLSVVALAGTVLIGAVPLPFRTPADRLVGWQGFAAAIRRTEAQAGADRVATLSYDLNSELAWLFAGYPQVEDLGNRARYTFEAPARKSTGRPLLLVVEHGDDTDGRLARCFAELTPVAAVERRSGNRVIETYQLVKASGAKPDVLATGCPMKAR